MDAVKAFAQTKQVIDELIRELDAPNKEVNTMADSDPKVNDKVVRMREPDRVGTVVEIEPDEYSFDDPIFHVVWVEGGPAIPHRRQGLKVVTNEEQTT